METIITSHYDNLLEPGNVMESKAQQQTTTSSDPGRPENDRGRASQGPIIDHREHDVCVDAPSLPHQGGSGNRGVHSVGLPKPAPSLFSSTYVNRCPPGTYDRAQFHGEDLDDPFTSPRNEIQHENARVPNIVIFGETGVGKSSVINLIADQKLAGTSNGALGCTFQHKRYHVTLGDTTCALWDTTGLDEGTEGTVPAELAENNLKELIQGLARSGGIHLIIYCIRGSRLTKALKRNYDLFYETVCRKKVPVALVVTGLELQLEEMESWWTTNEAALRRYGMRFDAHACVTTVDVEDDLIRRRRSESQTLLRELVVEFCGRSGWTMDPWILSWVLPLFRNSLRRWPFAGNSGDDAAVVRKVTVCGSFPEDIIDPQRRIGDKQYKFVRVDKRTFTAREMKERGGLGAGVLVFYTSPLVESHISQDDVDALWRFYNLAGGHSRPVIVALRGYDDEVARMCWGEFASRHSDIQAHPLSLPSALKDAVEKLDVMIETLYVEQPLEVKSSSFIRKLLGWLPFCLNTPATDDEYRFENRSDVLGAGATHPQRAG